MKHCVLGGLIGFGLVGCASYPSSEYYAGTLDPAAADAIYFVVTDRFVDGDPGNNQPDQGPAGLKTFDRPITSLDGHIGNIGYLGGDFRGILDNADYIHDMGFGALWLTPIVENPDEAFSGGHRLGEAFFADHGKTGYHGYWGVNFFKTDEHLVSPGLEFKDLTAGLKRHGLKTVLDIVCNHGSPSFSFPHEQPLFGELYDADGKLVADHQNVHPTELDDNNPLHDFFLRETDIAELSNIDDTHPPVLEYFVAAYLQWIEQGADAFRIDTIRHMPHSYWKAFSDRIREQHPGFFMFGESFNYEATTIAQHTYPANGAISVLDFPGQRGMSTVFGQTGGSYADLADYLHLTDGIYENPYELMTFYDNHDMPRMASDENGFINANNWLFTTRGIPVVYYGSETAFRAGRAEHGGNRDYYGQDRVDSAGESRIYNALRRIARLRRELPALQRGLQLNLALKENSALFLRALETEQQTQLVLVALNKNDQATNILYTGDLQAGSWRDVETGEMFVVDANQSALDVRVAAHGARLLILEQAVTDSRLRRKLDRLQHGVRAAARQRNN